MAPLVALLFVVALAVAYVFFRFQPNYANKKQLGVFNMMVLGVTGFLCLVWIANIRSSLNGTTDEHWIAPFSLGGSFAIIIVFLSVCFIARNFWIFRPPRRPGQGYF